MKQGTSSNGPRRTENPLRTSSQSRERQNPGARQKRNLSTRGGFKQCCQVITQLNQRMCIFLPFVSSFMQNPISKDTLCKTSQFSVPSWSRSWLACLDGQFCMHHCLCIWLGDPRHTENGWLLPTRGQEHPSTKQKLWSVNCSLGTVKFDREQEGQRSALCILYYKSTSGPHAVERSWCAHSRIAQQTHRSIGLLWITL